MSRKTYIYTFEWGENYFFFTENEDLRDYILDKESNSNNPTKWKVYTDDEKLGNVYTLFSEDFGKDSVPGLINIFSTIDEAVDYAEKEIEKYKNTG